MRRTRLAALAAALTLPAAYLAAAPASAVTFTQQTLSATVTGTSVTTTTKVAANPQTNATWWGVCARSSSGANLDFNRISGTISATGSTYTSSPKTFAAGTYRYWPCVLVSSTWYNVGAEKTFTVGGATPTPTPTPTPTATTTTPAPTPTPTVAPANCSATMPAAPTGKTQLLAEDFTRNAAVGQFGAVYGQNWRGYDSKGILNPNGDSRKKGLYDPDKVLSVSGGALHYDMQTVDGVPRVAAPVPLGYVGRTYYRASVCWKSNKADGYKIAFLQWPDSDDWNEGEIDWPEADTVGGTVRPASAIKGSAAKYSYNAVDWAAGTLTPAGDSATWHEDVMEWTAGHVRIYRDGKLITDMTQGVPNTPFHPVLQAETQAMNDTKPPADQHALIDVAWFRVDA